jgi:hypothetical protein
MLPVESTALEKQRIILFFYLNEFYLKSHGVLKRICDRFCENFKEFTIKIKVNNQQLGQMWNEMSMNFSGANTKPQVIKEMPVESES